MQKKMLPFLLIFSMLATCIEVDVSVPGFPQIAQYFNVADGIIQLTISYNFLGFCLGAFIYGPLSESFGRRKIMIIGNAIMLAGAVGCLFAPNIDFLLVSRFVQGIGASASVVLVFTIIADVYEGMQAMKLIGIVNACLSISMAIAPILGGFINQAVGWRGNYGFVVGMTLLSWLWIVVQLPETKKELAPLQTTQIVKDYLKVLSSMQFMRACLTPSLLFSAYMAYIAASSFLYIKTFGLSMMLFVTHQAIIIASFALTSLMTGKFMQQLGPKKMVQIGIGLSVVASLALLFGSALMPSSPYVITIFMSLFCVGFAICYPVIFSDSFSVFPALRGTASSVIMGLRALMVAGFTGLTSYLYNQQPMTVTAIICIGVLAGFVLTLSSMMSGRFSNQSA